MSVGGFDLVMCICLGHVVVVAPSRHNSSSSSATNKHSVRFRSSASVGQKEYRAAMRDGNRLFRLQICFRDTKNMHIYSPHVFIEH